MKLETYLDLMKQQKEMLTEEMKFAIIKQARLSKIALEKQKIKDDLEENYRTLFSIGLRKLKAQYPEVLDALPIADTELDTLLNLFDEVFNEESIIHTISTKMKSIPELVECEKLNLKIGKAYFDFFRANCELNRKIDSDREVLFSAEYREKMRELADDGVFLYYLETPDYPLLNDECDADYILGSLSFGNYISARTLFSSFGQIGNPGEPLKRKIEDAHAALEMMYNGCFRSAARNWFALIEHEHKRCAEILEGYWEVGREFKNGRQRSEKIFQIVDAIMDSWNQEAWEKIDKYYKKITSKQNNTTCILNRNAIIHGDYENDSLDVSENDAMRLFLMWVNLRVITDQLAFYEEFMRNKVTMLPYFFE